MKTSMKAILIAGMLIPTLSHAMDAQTEQVIAQKMSVVSTTQGAAIKMTDKKFVIDAVNKLHGDVSVDLGSQGQIKVNNNSRAAGGVLVGSGSDGLAIVSNKSASSNTLIAQPPMEVGTSLTVVGRGNEVYCSVRVEKDSKGKVLPYKRGDDRFSCNYLGHPLRLAEGTYILAYNHTLFQVDLKNGERKIIPLREIFVPKQQEQVLFSLAADSRSQVEVMKVATAAYSAMAVRMFPSLDTRSVEETAKRLVESIPDLKNDGVPSVGVEMFNNLVADFISMSTLKCYSSHFLESGYPGDPGATACGFPQSIVGDGHDGDVVSVLPGEYVFTWTIDNQQVQTKFTVK